MVDSSKELIGVLEWIMSEGGTVRVFNKYVVTGRIHEIPYRYFVDEGWIGLLVNDGTTKAVECKTLDSFRNEVTRAG